MTDLASIAPAFVEMAHRIVWCTVATVDPQGRPRTRVLHPVWEWDGAALTGWIATDPTSPKRRDLDAHPLVSLTYWTPNHDTCTADCATAWELDDDAKRAGWRRFAEAPAPVGYDPSIIPRWTSPEVAEFGILRLEPHRLRVMPGSFMVARQGELLTWRARR
jgi:hypothetical protein